MDDSYKKPERTEEIQAIIDRMPDKFGVWITFFVIILISVTAIMGWLIRYPDVVTGEIVISSNNTPVKLIANASGKLFLKAQESQNNVNEGDYIGIIENAANLHDIQVLQKLIEVFNIDDENLTAQLNIFPRNLLLGELNQKYSVFINSIEQFLIYKKDNIIVKQEEVLRKMLVHQQEMLNTAVKKLEMSSENTRLIGKAYNRDSILFSKKVLTEAELDKSRMTVLSVKEAHHSVSNDITSLKEQMQETRNKLEQTTLQKEEKKSQTRLDLIASFTDLIANIKAWEQKYAFKSPIKGRVQFSKFWANNQFIQSGEPFATIVPEKSKIYGQMTLPSYGAGKIKAGQEVIIKLDDYPYTEYGSIKGRISSISIVTNPIKTDKGEIATYMATVELPDKLKTNYGSDLGFKFQIKGTGEIIANDRKLAERLFDNLKYAVNK